MALTLRNTKGSELTWTEMDDNLTGLSNGSNWAATVNYTGTLTLTGVLSSPAGTVTLPGTIYAAAETGTGFYRIGANNVGFAVSGAKVLDIASTGLAVTGTLSSTGILSTTDATDATSAIAASLKTAGGIASVKGLWIGGTSRLVGAVTMDTSLTVSGTTSDGSSLLSSSQTGTGRALEIVRNTGSATRPVVGISQNSATGGSQAALLIRQADTGEVALGINTDGSLTVFNFKVLDTGATTTGALTTNGGLQTFLANDSAGAGLRYVVVPNA